MDNSLRVIDFQVQNYLGIIVAKSAVNANFVLIEGKNGSGKTSLVDGVWSNLGGKNYGGTEPVRKGADVAFTQVNLGPITVIRETTKEGKEKFQVIDSKGFKSPSPASLLKSFYQIAGFDIQHFIDMEDKERYDLLLRMSGQAAEIELLDQQRQRTYAERTFVNRQRDEAAAKVKGRGYNEAVVAGQKRQEKSMTEVLERIEEAREEDKKQMNLEQLIFTIKRAIEEKEKDIQRFEVEIKALEERITQYKATIKVVQTEKARAQAEITQTQKTLQSRPPSTTIAINQELSGIEAYNQQVREDNQVFDLLGEVAAHTTRGQALTQDIEAIDESKKNLLAASKLPITDISVEDGQLRFDGKPFADLSTTEQLIMSMRIGAALNQPAEPGKPVLRILRIQNGGEFTAERLRTVYDWAVENDYQIWIERPADEPSGQGIYIEAGEIKENRDVGEN